MDDQERFRLTRAAMGPESIRRRGEFRLIPGGGLRGERTEAVQRSAEPWWKQRQGRWRETFRHISIFPAWMVLLDSPTENEVRVLGWFVDKAFHTPDKCWYKDGRALGLYTDLTRPNFNRAIESLVAKGRLVLQPGPKWRGPKYLVVDLTNFRLMADWEAALKVDNEREFNAWVERAQSVRANAAAEKARMPRPDVAGGWSPRPAV